MTDVIRNFDRILKYVTDADKEKLQFGASLFKRYGNITFTILKADEE